MVEDELRFQNPLADNDDGGMFDTERGAGAAFDSDEAGQPAQRQAPATMYGVPAQPQRSSHVLTAVPTLSALT